tara:strand:- start:89 stop:487 length:399 start_codon:yes stop_codon:yes gene_type:complete
MKILVVDDSKTTRVQIERTIRESLQDYEIFHAENGVEALEVLQSNPGINIILSDINMPEMDGMALAQSVRKKKELNNIEILFLTTECSKDMKTEAKRIGVCAWIPKPAKPALLLNVLERVVTRIFNKNEALA